MLFFFVHAMEFIFVQCGGKTLSCALVGLLWNVTCYDLILRLLQGGLSQLGYYTKFPLETHQSLHLSVRLAEVMSLSPLNFSCKP